MRPIVPTGYWTDADDYDSDAWCYAAMHDGNTGPYWVWVARQRDRATRPVCPVCGFHPDDNDDPGTDPCRSCADAFDAWTLDHGLAGIYINDDDRAAFLADRHNGYPHGED